MRFKVLVLSLRRNRKKFRRYSYGFVLYFVNCRAAHAREGIDQRKIKMEGREGKIKVLSQPVVPSVARYRDDQLYQRLRLYANGRRLISIMSINLFLSFFSPRKKKKGDRQRQRQRQREREREREREKYSGSRVHNKEESNDVLRAKEHEYFSRYAVYSVIR